ncbi:hypothetical protein CJF31_00002705 [Rutstroemia sp. NJR-2017a BVV2]|nr:hypothetical protein CJF31_00002705 [Rutstroemia sp. NJR-2017a BVV2]
MEDQNTPSRLNTSTALDRRQTLLKQIYEFNSCVDTPLDLKIHISGLTIEEGSILERGHVSEECQITSPPISEEAINLQDRTQSVLDEKSAENVQLLIELRNLQREKETLEMEGRRRAAKEQADRRYEERCGIDRAENKALSDDMRFVEVPSDIPSAENGENAKTIPRRKSPPRGLISMAEARRKANREWIDGEKQRRMMAEDDEKIRGTLLEGVVRAIAVVKDVSAEVAKAGRDIIMGDDSEMLDHELLPQPTPVPPMLPPLHPTTRSRSNSRGVEEAAKTAPKVQSKVGPIQNKRPRPSAKNTPLLPQEIPVQWKLRMRRDELARNESEKATEVPTNQTESAGQIEDETKHKSKHRKSKVRPKDRDSTQQATKPSGIHCNVPAEEVEVKCRRKSPPASDQEAEAEQLRELEEKRQKREGKYKCYSTRSKIELENAAAYNRAQALAEEVKAEHPGQSGSSAEKAEHEVAKCEVAELNG